MDIERLSIEPAKRTFNSPEKEALGVLAIELELAR